MRVTFFLFFFFLSALTNPVCKPLNGILYISIIVFGFFFDSKAKGEPDIRARESVTFYLRSPSRSPLCNFINVGVMRMSWMAMAQRVQIIDFVPLRLRDLSRTDKLIREYEEN